MAGAKLSPLGADIRELIVEDQAKGGNPTWKTVGDSILKIAKRHGDKRDESKLSLVFQAHKVALQKQAGKPSSGKRGRPKKEATPALFETGQPIKATTVSGNRVGNGFAAFDLGIKFAKEVGGLDKALETLQLIKQVKDSV